MADTAPGTVIGPGNVISANLIGVLISGPTATNVTVIGNLIGTDSTGEADLGNAQAGVDIENATGAIDRRERPRVAGHLGQPDRRGDRRCDVDQNLIEGNFIGDRQGGHRRSRQLKRRGR